jgi:hypothetical protein
MIAQYLAAAGEDIGAGRPIGAAVGKVTSQQIQNQNYVKMLQKLLAGGGKIQADSQNVTIKAPVGAFGQNQQASDPVGATMSAPKNLFQIGSEQPPTQSQPTQQPVQSQSTSIMSALLGGAADTPNPSSSPLGNISAADLAGLTTQDISQALHFKTTQDEMDRRNQLDEVRERLALRKLELDTMRAIAKGDEKTAGIKEYEYAVRNGYTGTFTEFKNTSSSAGIEDYNKAVSQGYKGSYLDWKLKLASAGRSNVTVNVEGKKELAQVLQDVKDSRYFTDPASGIGADFGKHLETRGVRQNLLKYDPKSNEYVGAKAEEAEKFYEQKFKQGGAQVLERRVEGRDLIWKVKFPDGTVKEIRYGN